MLDILLLASSLTIIIALQPAWHTVVDLDVDQAHQRMISGATPDRLKGPFVQRDGTLSPCPAAWVFLNVTVMLCLLNS